MGGDRISIACALSIPCAPFAAVRATPHRTARFDL